MGAMHRLLAAATAILLLILPPTTNAFDNQDDITCKICEGTDQEVGSPDKIINLGELGSHRCGDINDILASTFISQHQNASISSQCPSLQSSLGSLCDCPRKEESTTKPNQCDICPFSMGFPNRPLPFLKDTFGGGIFTPTCEMVHAHLLSLAINNDEICTSTRWLISDYCGCGLINTEWHSSCSLCAGASSSPTDVATTTASGAQQGKENQTQQTNSSFVAVASTDPHQTLNNNPALPFDTCGELEEAVSLVFVQDSQQCSSIQNLLGIHCGCPNPSIENHPCHLCPDGTNPILFPDKEVPFLSHLFSSPQPSTIKGTELQPLLVPTCSMVESLALSLDEDSETCAFLQLGSSSFCGCPPRQEGHCELCPEYDEDGDFPPSEYSQIVLWPGMKQAFPGGMAPTCEMASWFQYQLAPDDDLCLMFQARSDLCGCNDGEFAYLFADTHTKRVLLAWLPRITSILSIMGALLIIVDVLRTPARRKRVYNQLVLLMSVFDLIYLIAYAMTTYPTPTHDEFGNDWKVYGAHGTEASCKAQGFALQLGGGTSTFFNASLATYYVCVFVLGWKDRGRKSRSVWVWFLLLPIVLGVVLSFIGLPYYGSLFVMCHVLFPPLIASSQPRLWLVSIPTMFCIIWGTIMMVVVYVALRHGTFAGGVFQKEHDRHHRNHNKDELAGEVSDDAWTNQERMLRIKREVFWQCLFYLVAFYLTWPIWLYQSVANGTPAQAKGYPFHIVASMISPLQGFFNVIVYFRPRYWRYFQRRQCHTRVQQRNEEHDEGRQEAENNTAGRDSVETTFVSNTKKKRAPRQQAGVRDVSLGTPPLTRTGSTLSVREDHFGFYEDQEARLPEKFGFGVSETECLDPLDGCIEPSAIIACDIGADLKELRWNQGASTTASAPHETVSNLTTPTNTRATSSIAPNNGIVMHVGEEEEEVQEQEEYCVFVYPEVGTGTCC